MGKLLMKKPDIVLMNGEPSAVILKIKEYERILEYLEDAEDLAELKELKRSSLKFRKFEDFMRGHSLNV